MTPPEEFKPESRLMTALGVVALRLSYFFERRKAAALCLKFLHIVDTTSSSLE
jgi:hypothetical protein